MEQSRQQAIEDYSIFETMKVCRFNFTLQASRISSVTHSTYHHPHTRKAPRMPYRRFTIYSTIWKLCPCHMWLPDASRFHSCLPSSLIATPAFDPVRRLQRRARDEII